MRPVFGATRRSVLQALAGGAGLLAAGCNQKEKAAIAAPPKPETAASRDVPFLAPFTINKAKSLGVECIDVHAHFFNASDVPIEGFLEGPVAHSMPNGFLAALVRALAPIADGLGVFAITAKQEHEKLLGMGPGFREFTPQRAHEELNALQQTERRAISEEFYRLTQTPEGKQFREEYRRLMSAAPATESINGSPRVRDIEKDSVFRAMYMTEQPASEAQLIEMEAVSEETFGEGVLAFVGYMMSARWSNLQTYKRAFSTSSESVGVNQVLGALVNFDGWLDGKLRSPHRDQMELHALMSRLSGGYMRPIMSYNPWPDAMNAGESLALLRDAKKLDFVGAKIYPPNGFRPWGNAGKPPDRRGGPTGDQIDQALEAFWIQCHEWNFPVMAHAGPSMGRDDAHDFLSGPNHWGDLLNAKFWTDDSGPRVNLGHFGGETNHDKAAGKDWPDKFGSEMGKKRGEFLFADLGYWDGLQCPKPGKKKCVDARARLANALKTPVGTGTVADRVMFGSDWLMLSKEKNWPSYARQLFKSVQAVAPASAAAIFSGNARRLFTAL
ncbi:MAG TPA: amidohydrolase family protein [Steroidobacteraceae bacterium]